MQLRLLCKDEVTLIEQRTQLVNQLQQAVLEYYPAALEAFEDWTLSFCWDFVIEFPTPEKLLKAKAHRWRKFLHTHRLWRPGSVDKRLEIFGRATDFQGSSAVVQAKSQPIYKGSVDPEKIDLFRLPLPEPEDRSYYFEFETGVIWDVAAKKWVRSQDSSASTTG